MYHFMIKMKKEDDSATKKKSVPKKIVPIDHSMITDVSNSIQIKTGSVGETMDIGVLVYQSPTVPIVNTAGVCIEGNEQSPTYVKVRSIPAKGPGLDSKMIDKVVFQSPTVLIANTAVIRVKGNE